MKYDPALDGLRAMAVLMVVVGHSHPRLKGGALGVDVFFCLSGFLITTLILQERTRSSGAFGYRNFYIRRALRLFPALYVMLAVVGGWVLVRWNELPRMLSTSGGERKDVASFFIGAATYTTNIGDLTGRAGNLLGHTWSLAVEEQFYLVWPVLLLAMVRKGRLKLAVGAVAAAWILLLLARLAMPSAAAGVLASRPDGLVAGVLVAVLRRHRPHWSGFVARWSTPLGLASLVGVAGLAALRTLVADGTMFSRGGFWLLSVLVAGLIWSLVDGPRSSLRAVLEVRPLVSVGLASYGIYLWHQPIFRIVGWELAGQPNSFVLGVKWAASAVAVVISYKLIEVPARRLQSRYRPVTVQAAGPVLGNPTSGA